MMKNSDIDSILHFYENKKNKNLNKFYEKTPNIVVNYNSGVGDTLTTLCVQKLAESQGRIANGIAPASPHFDLLKGLAGVQSVVGGNQIDVHDIQYKFDFGNGSLFQKVQRACGLKPHLAAKAFLGDPLQKEKGKIALSFDVGSHANNQKNIHPQARQLYKEHFESIQEFINENQSKYRFVEVGLRSFGFKGVENKCANNILKTVREISSCEYFVGMHSGLMHVASSFDLKCVILLNFPSAKQIYLPVLKNIDIVDVEWLDPRHVYLHEDEDGELVKKMSKKNLTKALNGELFPYWKHDHLDLIDDAI